MNEETITVGIAGIPVFTLMRGHVDSVVFGRAFEKEGWLRENKYNLIYGYGYTVDGNLNYSKTKDKDNYFEATILPWH